MAIDIKEITFSLEQQNAVDKIIDWYKNKTKDQQIFTLVGFAGTGKSTIISFLNNLLPNIAIAYATFTGKASSVIKKKLEKLDVYPDYVGTIHSMIYIPIPDEKGDVTFILRPEFEIELDLIVIDESSMVNDDLFRDLMSFNIPILFVGDNGQLPPIKGSSIIHLDNPDFELTEIHRQAINDPIIKLSCDIRSGIELSFGQYAKNVCILNSRSMDHKEFINTLIKDYKIDTDIIICGMNRTRCFLNSSIKKHMFEKGIVNDERNVSVGDKVICLKNNKKIGIFNGMIGIVTKIDFDPFKRSQAGKQIHIHKLTINFDGNEITCLANAQQFLSEKTLMNENYELSKRIKERIELFDFGYTITAHKCISDDTLLFTNKGMQKIGKLNNNDIVISGKGNKRNINLYSNVGEKEYIEIETKKGYKIKASKEHKFLIADENGEKYIEGKNIDIKKHHVCINRSIVPGIKNKNINIELSWIIGALIGDGCYSSKRDYCVAFTKPTCIDVMNRFKLYFEKQNIKVNTRFRNNIIYTYDFFKKEMRLKLLNIGLKYVTANNKKIPEVFFTIDVENRKSLLQGLFDTDGSISNNMKRCVRYTTSSKKLIYQMQILLLSLGIISTVSKQNDKHYQISISGLSFYKFKEMIGFSNKKRKKILNEILDFVKSDSEYIPFGHKLIQEYKNKRLNLRRYGYNKQNKISRNLLNKLYNDITVSNNIKEVIKNNYFYDSIKTIKYYKEKIPMSDIEVDVDNSYIANGFVVHNSQGSEFKNVIIFREPCRLWDQHRWDYTAVTRAIDNVCLIYN